MIPRSIPGIAEASTASAYTEALNPRRTSGVDSTVPTTPIAITAASTPSSQPKISWADSRNTNDSDTIREPLSSSGTGLNSAAIAASVNTSAPASTAADGERGEYADDRRDHHRQRCRHHGGDVPVES